MLRVSLRHRLLRQSITVCFFSGISCIWQQPDTVYVQALLFAVIIAFCVTRKNKEQRRKLHEANTILDDSQAVPRNVSLPQSFFEPAKTCWRRAASQRKRKVHHILDNNDVYLCR